MGRAVVFILLRSFEKWRLAASDYVDFYRRMAFEFEFQHVKQMCT